MRNVDKTPPTTREIVIKTVVTHTVTYFICGLAAYTLLDYPTLIRETDIGTSFRPLGDPMVAAGPALQPIRGLLFGVVFSILKAPFFGAHRGWLVMWASLVSIGILGTFAAPPGSIEGLIYTRLPLSLHLTMLPEIILQSLLLSWLLFLWVNHPERTWIGRTMGVAFLLVLMMSALGVVAAVRP
jgi:hypothetical protein